MTLYLITRQTVYCYNNKGLLLSHDGFVCCLYVITRQYLVIRSKTSCYNNKRYAIAR